MTKQNISKVDLKDSMDAFELFIDENAPVYRDYLLLEGDGLTVRKDDWKYIPSRDSTKKGELFNMKDTILEQRNHINDNLEVLEDLQNICVNFNFR